MSAREPISIVFAGGGCRTFWSLGAYEVLSSALPTIREWAGVSAGSAMAISAASNSTGEVLEAFKRRVGENRWNCYPWRPLLGQRAFPQEAIYRATMREVMDESAQARLQSASPVRILQAYVQQGRPMYSTVYKALRAYSRRRKAQRVHGPETPPDGIGEAVFNAQSADALETLIDQVIASSATPPVTSTPTLNGCVYFDGSLVDNVPVRALTPAAREGKVLVLLNRPMPAEHLPNTSTRLYLMPKDRVPVHKWDYTSPDKVQATVEQGRRDAEGALAAVRAFTS